MPLLRDTNSPWAAWRSLAKKKNMVPPASSDFSPGSSPSGKYKDSFNWEMSQRDAPFTCTESFWLRGSDFTGHSTVGASFTFTYHYLVCEQKPKKYIRTGFNYPVNILFLFCIWSIKVLRKTNKNLLERNFKKSLRKRTFASWEKKLLRRVSMGIHVATAVKTNPQHRLRSSIRLSSFPFLKVVSSMLQRGASTLRNGLLCQSEQLCKLSVFVYCCM